MRVWCEWVGAGADGAVGAQGVRRSLFSSQAQAFSAQQPAVRAETRTRATDSRLRLRLLLLLLSFVFSFVSPREPRRENLNPD